MQPAVFLDRDNTLIHNDGDLGDPEQVRLIQGAASAIASLRGLGFRIVVVTNQGGVARGKYGEDDVRAVHDRLAQLVRDNANGALIDGFYFCPYHPQGSVQAYTREHEDRKPAPGMLLRAAEDLKLDLGQSWLIGDQERDVQAGAAAGVRTILLDDEVDAPTPLEVTRRAQSRPPRDAAGGSTEADFVARHLIDAVRIIAQQRKPEAFEVPGERRPALDAEAMSRLQRPREAGNAPPPARPGEPPRGRPEAKPFAPWSTRRGGAGPSVVQKVRSQWQQRAEGDAVEDAAGMQAPPPVDPPGAAAEVTSDPEPEPPPSRTPAETGQERALRLILQELRQQRGGDAFSGVHLAGLALQAVAVLLLLGALLLGEDTASLLRWIGAALVVQLLGLALLVTR
jgi:D-glycero-D-manno-heptose 1,7-bisphosphate phosphatase